MGVGGQHVVVVMNEAQLRAALVDNTTVRLGADIYLGAQMLLAEFTDFTLDGDGFKVDGNGSVSCFAVTRQAHVRMVDLTLAHCVGSGNNGGAVTFISGILALEWCFIVDNQAAMGGGGVLISGGVFEATDTVFSGNRGGFGAGVMVEGGFHSFTRCLFSNNVAAYGGALACTPFGGGVELRLDACTIENNVATQDGGGLMLEFEMDVILRGSVVRNNSAGQSGGGIFMALGATVLRVSDTNVSANSAVSFGGGIFAEISPIFIDGPCSFTNNSCGLDGGGLYIQANPSTASPSFSIGASLVVSGNRAGRNGGGVLSYGGLVSHAPGVGLRFNANVADTGSGGGLYVSYAGVTTQQALSLSDASFEANRCGNKGGALLIEVRGIWRCSLKQCVVWYSVGK